ncbi:ECF transporter S component [Clostridium thermarum]|uniref:ECF transporter S component n=1 Tax=Clostridium thermarum TaxID=1716543 RepID=UPI0013D29206|nr:ECF transporter S component [Clostridium thermarum]
MRKFIMLVSILLMLVLMGLGFIYGSRMRDYSLMIIFAVLLILSFSYLYFEKSNMGTKEIAVIGTLSAFGGAARVPFVALPNVQPTTFLVALSGYVFGPYEGFLVGTTTAFISNIFLGQGPWTPWQMFAWGLIGFISGIIGLRNAAKNKKMSSEGFAMLCFFYGFLFDWIMNLWHVLGFIRPLTLEKILTAYIVGLTFDIIHAGGNFVFAIILFENLYKVLYRFKKRVIISYIKE